MLKLASSTSPYEWANRNNTTVSRILDFENFPLYHSFLTAKNLYVNSFARNTSPTQHDLAIQTTEAESTGHQFFDLEKMGRSGRQCIFGNKRLV
jgi:hypothetical protein